MIRKIVLLVTCLYAGFIVNAQNSAVGPEKVILPAPDVTAIQRYGNWPMGNFTGTATVNLPLFNITCGKLKFPVNLSYNSSGIKTNDAGSNVGIGWALNATGVINRNMMGGQVDEQPTYGYWVTYPFPHSLFQGNPDGEIARMDAYAVGNFDGQPDIFNYSVNGLSGKFTFDNLQNVLLMPYNNLKVDKTISAGTTNTASGVSVSGPITGLTITDENGTIYQFKDCEYAWDLPWVYTDLDVNPNSPGDIRSSDNYVFTWYLTNIISADSKDTIHFDYDINRIVYNVYGGSAIHQTFDVNSDMISPIQPYRTHTIMHNTIDSKVLKRISFRTGYIQFYNGTSRLDMQGGKALDSVAQYDYENNRLSSYHFDYTYLSDTSMLSAANVPGGTPQQNIRLFLHTMQQKGINGAVVPPYTFAYEHSYPLPSKMMGGGDIWGLANGKVYAGIYDSLQAFDFNNFEDAPDALKALMTPNFNYAKQGILTNIKYPTGASTSFLYEPHYKEIQTRSTTTQVCEGNMNIEFTGVDFDPGPHGGGDPDAPGPRKFIVTTTATVDVTVSLDYRYNNFPTYYYIEIRDSATNTLKYTYYKSSVYCDSYTSSPYPVCVKHVALTPGTYYIMPKNTGTTYSGSASDIYCKMTLPPFNCSNVATTVSDSVSVGGVRIKETIDEDPVTGQSLAKLYEYNDGIKPNLFTGNYLTETEWYYADEHEKYFDTRERILSSNSTWPLTDMSGFYVCYGNVKETQVDVNTGKTMGYTINYYNNDIDDGLHDGDFKFMSYPPYTAQTWKRGKLIRTLQYKVNSSDQPVLMQDKMMHYSDLKPKGRAYGDAFFQFFQYYPMSLPKYIYDTSFHEYITPLFVNHTTFYYQTSYNVMDSVTVKDYDDNGGMVGTTTAYVYDTTTLLPKSVSVSTSKGELITTRFTRPFDLTGLTGSDDITLGVRKLQDARVLAAPVEVVTNRANINGSNNRTIGSVFTSYKPDKLLRDKIYATEKAGPMTDFVPAAVSGGHITMDSRYQSKVSFDAYDNFNNLSRQHKENDMTLSYIWDYQHGYPVAEVKNAVDTNMAYTSFEAENPGNWSVGTGSTDSMQSITGRKSYVLSGSISKSGLVTAHAYIVSYWTRNTSSFSITGTIAGFPLKGKTINGWTFYLHKVTGQSTVTVNGSGPIDELRLYPSDAQMTTFTFQPLVGMTSQCNAASQITYYEYDGLQRLKYIRDQDGNILKSYEYRYQAVTSCGSNCSILQMTTLAGTNTLGYPVGVFNVSGQLLGNAANQSQYISLWNADTANAHRGTLATGADPLHFQFTLIPGKTIPAITGCRYFQMDIAWNNINAIRSCNGAYIDFGDGTGMHLAAHVTDSLAVLAPNTTQTQAAHPEWNGYTWYYIHSYPDNSLKTLTFYHNDQAEISGLDNNGYPASSLPHLRNLRGNLPQYTDNLGGSCYQDSSMSTVAGITNWNTIHSIKSWGHGSGDVGMTPALHLGYAQDFMAGNRDLEAIGLAYPAFIGCFDSTFRISRLKSDWNTYFTHLKSIYISDALWNREDLSGLKELNAIYIIAGREKYTNDPTNNPQIPIPSSVLDNIFIQVAAGAGQTVTNGYINIYSGGPNRTAASDAAVATLLAKGWILYLNGIQIH